MRSQHRVQSCGTSLVILKKLRIDRFTGRQRYLPKRRAMSCEDSIYTVILCETAFWQLLGMKLY